MKLYPYGYFLLRGENGRFYLNRQGKRLINLFYKPPRQHGKPRKGGRFNIPKTVRHSSDIDPTLDREREEEKLKIEN